MPEGKATKTKSSKAPGTRPPKPTIEDKRAIQVDAIIEAALAEIDEHGLEAFRIRNLADRLNVRMATIYWYLPSRELILSEVVRRVLVDVAPRNQSAFWRDRLRELFNRFREAVSAHPNVAPLTTGTLIANATADLAFVEATLSIVRDAGLRGHMLIAGYNAIIATIAGFVSEEFAAVPQSGTDYLKIQVAANLAKVSPIDHPILHEHLDTMANKAFFVRWENGATSPLIETYSYLIDIMIIGIESLVTAQNIRNQHVLDATEN